MCVCVDILPAGLSVLAEQPVWELLSARQLEGDWSLTHCRLSEGNPLKDRGINQDLYTLYHFYTKTSIFEQGFQIQVNLLKQAKGILCNCQG